MIPKIVLNKNKVPSSPLPSPTMTAATPALNGTSDNGQILDVEKIARKR